MSKKVGLFSVDPGGASGLAWGIFDPYAKTFQKVLDSQEESGSDTTTGEWYDQIPEIGWRWRQFFEMCVFEAGLPVDRVELVMEDFIMIPGSHVGGIDDTLSARIIGGLVGYRMGALGEWERWGGGPVAMSNLVLQGANQASTFATGTRLKEWGIWVKGREHERSAWKHIALRLNKIHTQALARRRGQSG